MPLRVYNTLTREKEDFRTLQPGRVTMYLCGPTVYSDAHLGHAKKEVAFDVIRRALMHFGYTVRYVTNVTDVGHLQNDADEGEDKLLARARLEQLEPMEVADKYFWSFVRDMDALNVLKPSINPRAELGRLTSAGSSPPLKEASTRSGASLALQPLFLAAAMRRAHISSSNIAGPQTVYLASAPAIEFLRNGRSPIV